MNISFEELVKHMKAQNLGLCADSRKVEANDIFIALSGTTNDGEKYINDAIKKGVKYILAKDFTSDEKDIYVHSCENSFKTMVELAKLKYDTMDFGLNIVGITGTNGKTTTTYLLEHLFKSKGRSVGVLGTIKYRWQNYSEDAPLTTPDTLSLHAMLGAMKKAKVQDVFMEVSSHALEQNRVAGISFNGAVFANLTQDHLDYHKTMENYFKSKAKLFNNLAPTGVSAICADDDFGKKLLVKHKESIAYGINRTDEYKKYLWAEIIENTPQGLHLKLDYNGDVFEIKTPLVGEYNARNILAACAIGLGHGFNVEDLQCFSTFNGVDGRLERIGNDPKLNIFVDYAHTGDALVNVLSTLRDAGFTKIITVFGCGGNRDRAKRPLMGEAVAKYSDVAVLTSDNPRHENPLDIIEDVKAGLTEAKHVIIEENRKIAIEKAFNVLKEYNSEKAALLIAGKGHEQTQQVGDIKYAFSDQIVAKELLCK